MIGFNPDGSIKLPDALAKQKAEQSDRMKHHQCCSIKRNIVSITVPKKCRINIRLSEAIKDADFVLRVHDYFSKTTDVPTKLSRPEEREYEIEIGTCFSRCSDCTKLISRLREFLDGNVIEDRGGCTYRTNGFGQGKFAYEDYFD